MQGSADDALLTDLCAICHANLVKYTCPRCGIHTCSLPCVKRHKSWAQCSGVRNPAAYRKRADLATPSSIDQDFNFITSVERSLQKADALVSDKGIDLAPSGLGVVKRPGGGSGPETKRRLEVEIADRGVHVIKAPQGLSRNKQNKTHWHGLHKCISWTTEWIWHQDGEERRIQNVPETRTVGEGFLSIFGKKSLRRKRKRSDAETSNVPLTQHDTTTTNTTPPPQPDPQDTSAVQDLPPPTVKEEAGPDDDAGLDNADPVRDEPVKEAPSSEPVENTTQAQDVSQLLNNLHFYLLRPNTTAKLKCLIPISTDSSLMDVMRNKTVLEFPTFYVRDEPADALTEPFIGEEKYDELHGSEVAVPITNLPTYTPAETLELQNPVSLPDSIDEKRVLEVLQQDLSG